MGITSSNVMPGANKPNDYEKGMQLGAQLSQTFQALAQMKQQQAESLWATTRDMINIVGDDIIGGDTAAAEKLRPLIARSMSRLTGEREDVVNQHLDSFFKNIDPNFKRMLETTGVNYVWHGDYQGENTPPSIPQQQPPTQNTSQTSQQPTQPQGQKILQYQSYEPEVINAFSKYGVGSGRSIGNELPPERETAVRADLKNAGFDQQKIDFVIGQYKKNGYIPRTMDPKEITIGGGGSQSQLQTPPAQNNVRNIMDVGEIKRSTINGKTTFSLTPAQGQKPMKMLEGVVKASGVDTKGQLAQVDMKRYYKLTAEENIPQMAKLLGEDEAKMRERYKSRPNEMVEDFNSLAGKMTDIALPVQPGSPEYSNMFAVGVSEQKVKEIKGAVDNLQTTLDKLDSGGVSEKGAVAELISGVDTYTSKLVKTGNRIATNPTYMKNVFNRIGGGDPENPTKESMLKGIEDTMDQLMSDPTRVARINQETELSYNVKLNNELSKMGLDYQKFLLDVQQFEWGKQLSQAQLGQAYSLAMLNATQQKIANEKEDRSTIENTIAKIDEALLKQYPANKGEGAPKWATDEKERAKLYNQAGGQFKDLWDRKMMLLSTMTGIPLSKKSVSDQGFFGMGAWSVEFPYVDTSGYVLPPTPTEQVLMNAQQTQPNQPSIMSPQVQSQPQPQTQPNKPFSATTQNSTLPHRTGPSPSGTPDDFLAKWGKKPNG